MVYKPLAQVQPWTISCVLFPNWKMHQSVPLTSVSGGMTGMLRALATTASVKPQVCHHRFLVAFHDHHGFLAALVVVLGLVTLVDWTNWLLLVPVHRLDTEPHLAILTLLVSFSLWLWSVLPLVNCADSPFQPVRSLSLMQRDCLTTGSDDKTPANLGDHNGAASWQETFSRHFWFGHIRNSELETEIRIRDFRRHFSGAPPPESLRSTSQLHISVHQCHSSCQVPLRTRENKPSQLSQCHTSSTRHQSVAHQSLQTYTPKSLSVSGNSSCNMASHCAASADAVAATFLVNCVYDAASCAGVRRNDDTGTDGVFST